LFPRARSCWPAVAFSVVVHALLVLPVWIAFLGRTASPATDPVILDTRVSVPLPKVEYFISFDEPRRRPPAAANTPSVPVQAPVVNPDRVILASRSAPLTPWFGQGQIPIPAAAGDGLGHGTERGGAGGAATSFFQIPATGRSVVYVIDRSASMGLNGAWAAARRELQASLDRLGSEVCFQIIAYNRGAEPLRIGGHTDLVPATSDHKRQAMLLVEFLRAEGGTDHLAALKRALLLQPDVIFFLTDADDLTPILVQSVTQFNHGRTVIHAVELSPSHHSSGTPPLQDLARGNRGMYQRVNPTLLAQRRG
jgi:hypothetical protein